MRSRLWLHADCNRFGAPIYMRCLPLLSLLAAAAAGEEDDDAQMSRRGLYHIDRCALY